MADEDAPDDGDTSERGSVVDLLNAYNELRDRLNCHINRTEASTLARERAAAVASFGEDIKKEFEQTRGLLAALTRQHFEMLTSVRTAIALVAFWLFVLAAVSVYRVL